MRNSTRILLGVLVVSVAANIYQLATRPPDASQEPYVVRVDSPPKREDVWWPKRVPLAGTGYEAHAGPWRYSTPQVYTVSVERPFAGGAHTLFEREFRVSELPDGFLDRPAEEVVSFDPATRTVTFVVGDQRVEYRLPPVGE